MHLHDYLSALRKRCTLIVLAVALALSGATAAILLTPSRYAGSVTFFVNAQTKGGVADAYEGDLFSQKRVSSYVDLLKSDRLAEMIVTSHPVGLSSARFRRGPYRTRCCSRLPSPTSTGTGLCGSPPRSPSSSWCSYESSRRPRSETAARVKEMGTVTDPHS